MYFDKSEPYFQMLFDDGANLFDKLELFLGLVPGWKGIKTELISYSMNALADSIEDSVNLERLLGKDKAKNLTAYLNPHTRIPHWEPLKRTRLEGEFSKEELVSTARENPGCWLSFKGFLAGKIYSTVTISPSKGRQKSIIWEGHRVGATPETLQDKQYFREIEQEQGRLMENAVKTMCPFYADGGVDDHPAFQYFSDAYNFTSPPDRHLMHTGTLDFLVTSDPKTFEKNTLWRAVKTKASTTETRIARKLLSPAELQKIISIYVNEAVFIDGGCWVWRKKRFLTPRVVGQLLPSYYIRKELRRRGAKLYFGTIEQELLALLQNAPRILLNQGIVRKKMVKLFESKKQELDIQLEKNHKDHLSLWKELDEATLKLLSKEEKHELGLDLPKPPEWMLKPEGGN